MDENNSELIEQITNDAEKIYNELQPEQRWQLAVDEWLSIEERISPTRPTRADVENFIKGTVKRILLKITRKEARFTRVFLNFVVGQVIAYLITDLQFQSLIPYRFGIGFIATLVIDAVIEEASSKLDLSEEDKQ